MSKNILDKIQADMNGKNSPEKNAKKTLEKNEKKGEKKIKESIDVDKKPQNAKSEAQKVNHESSHEENHEQSHEESHEEKEEIEDLDWDDLDLEELDLEDIDEQDEDEDLDEDEDWEEDDEDEGGIAESDEDPLSYHTETKVSDNPPTVTVEQVKEKAAGSQKNLKNLERLGLLAIKKGDKIKAKICSNISGEHMAEYTADDELLEALVEAVKGYIDSLEAKPPTPFGTLMLAVAMWTLPPIGLAFWDKYELRKQEKQALTNSTTENKGESQTDYSHLKEYKKKRKIFTVNKSGMYNRTEKGTFIKKELCDEQPSPEIQSWLDEEKASREIRNLLYGK